MAPHSPEIEQEIKELAMSVLETGILLCKAEALSELIAELIALRQENQALRADLRHAQALVGLSARDPVTADEPYVIRISRRELLELPYGSQERILGREVDRYLAAQKGTTENGEVADVLA